MQPLVQVTLCLSLVWGLSFCLTLSAMARSFPGLIADLEQRFGHSSHSISRSRINGISYEVRGQGNTSLQTDDNRIRMSNGRDVVEIREGRVYFNGRVRGVVKSGDSIVLDETGNLSITP